MFAIVPLLCILFTFCVFYVKPREHNALPCWRGSFLSAAVVGGLLLTTITEVLSFFNSITFGWLLSCWVLASLISAFTCFVLVKKATPRINFEIPRIPRSIINSLVSTAGIVFVVGMIALLSPPNTWDSMTYHMSRVAHWIQNQTVIFYPTSIMRQNHQNPWAEFACLHLQVLSGTDRFANLVQWFSMVATLVGISLITKQFGANLRAQIFAVVVCVTIPMGILQASSTQTDYVVSFWLVCFVYYVTSLLTKEKMSWMHILALGSSLGLAILTKGTAYIFAFPFLVWFVLLWLKKLRWRICGVLFVMGLVAICINLGHYERNFGLYGSPLGPTRESRAGYKYANEVFTVPSVFSNTVRNIALHIGTRSGTVNRVMETAVGLLHKLINFDINDSRTTWTGTEFHVSRMTFHEDSAGNPIHLVLIAVCVAILINSRKLRKSRNLMTYSIALAFAFLLFSLCLKWQPWHSRLHLPFFVLWSPFIAIVLAKIPNDKTANQVVIILILLALPWVFCNKSRPIIRRSNIFNTSRIDKYFNNRQSLRKPYIEAARFLNNQKCSHIGLYFVEEASWEYPLWVLLQKNGNKALRIEHVNIETHLAVKSVPYPLDHFSPCAIISIDSGQRKQIVNQKDIFIKVWSSEPLSIFLKR